jgi:hypothetical protein
MNGFQEMSVGQINEIIKEIRSKFDSKKILTNYFCNLSVAMYVCAKKVKETVIFYLEEKSFKRLFFYSANVEQLGKLLDIKIENCLIDFIYKYRNMEFESALINIGYKELACYKRIYNDAINDFLKLNEISRLLRYYKENIILSADVMDAEELYVKMNASFDIKVSHFPTLDELRDIIAKKQVLIIKNNNEICSYLIFNFQGKKCYLNFLFNDTFVNPMNSIALLIKLYTMLKEEGINYSYAWVDGKNIPALNIHKMFGYKYDRLEDRIYYKGAN